jgi:hypothetical protein
MQLTLRHSVAYFRPLIITDANIFTHYTELLAHKGRAMTQTITGELLTVKARDQSQASDHEVFGGQSTTRKGLSSYVFACQQHSSNVQCSFIRLSR